MASGFGLRGGRNQRGLVDVGMALTGFTKRPGEQIGKAESRYDADDRVVPYKG
jgi:hypothetical protein